MGLVTDQHHLLPALGLLGCQQLGGLGNKVGALEARGSSKAAHDLCVDPPYARSRLGKVDQGMAAGVERRRGSPHRDGLAGSDLAGHHARGPLGDHPRDAGERLGMGLGSKEHARGQLLSEGHAGEAVVGTEPIDAHGMPSPLASSFWVWSS